MTQCNRTEQGCQHTKTFAPAITVGLPGYKLNFVHKHIRHKTVWGCAVDRGGTSETTLTSVVQPEVKLLLLTVVSSHLVVNLNGV